MSTNISLRVLEKADTNFLHRMLNNPAVMDYWFSEAHQSKAAIEETFDKYRDDNTMRRFILQNEAKPVGLVTLDDINFIHRKAEFGIMIDPEQQGNGYAIHATNLAIEYAFRTLNLHKLYLIADKVNEKAIHIYEKAGFKQEAVMKDEYFVNGSYHDIVYMSTFQND